MTRLEEELRVYQQQWALLSAEDHSPAAIQCVNGLGYCYRALGRWADAMRVFDSGVARSQAAGNPDGVLEFTYWKSNLLFHMGRYEDAIALVTEVIQRTPPGLHRIKLLYYDLAGSHLALGQVERYCALQDEALAAANLLSETESSVRATGGVLAWVWCHWAQGQNLTGHADQAYPVLLRAVESFRTAQYGGKTGHRHGLPYSLLRLGENRTCAGRCAQAKEALLESMALYQENQREAFVVDALVALSRNAVQAGDLGEARLRIDAALAEARLGPRSTEGLADTRTINAALTQAAQVYVLLNALPEAAAYFDEAWSLAASCKRGKILRELAPLEGLLRRAGGSVNGSIQEPD